MNGTTGLNQGSFCSAENVDPETNAGFTKVDYSVSAGLARRLNGLGLSLAFSSYRSGFLYMAGVKPGGGVNIHQMAFHRPMGIHRHSAHGLSVAADNQILHHLNGLAIQDGQPRYVTAVSRSDTIDGWRDRRADGGIIIDAETNDIVCDGLSMPHLPRLHEGRLWLLNSGRGELGTMEFDQNGKGNFEPHVFCPGFTRGLALNGRYAFVGLSKPRYKRFEGLEPDARLAAADSVPWCGIQIIDLETRTCVDWLRIDGAESELYDLEHFPGHLCPVAIAPGTPEAATLKTLPKSA
ncbi:DUF4915 domain-containing protein [Ruegeria lacuscaerulensis]|uniref:DUF4915 domain-containing protein n=1 Tax=Ruegeria lacuscaerulensis TaxID=55218 RepID=UPI001479CD11|nr:DUF4915 domain-containing protein [Ruegeria lacuscaerulensis]